ncbi:MAG TPA: cytochrome c3 family protein [Phycisphaerales bacterium]|nr:cytochrome c3 family protein [Phycisphaerales bacterium]
MSTIFPKWTNQLPTMLLGGALGTLALVVGGAWYYATPKFWRNGYMPAQPGISHMMEVRLETDALANNRAPEIPGQTYPGFSHQIHAGKLGLDCRYCHSQVENSAEANIPTVSTCIGCHADGHVNDELYARKRRVQFIRDAWEAGVRYDEIAALKRDGKYEEADAKAAEYKRMGLEVVEGGASIDWRRVHKLPDYVRNFPHNVHLNAGVSCYSCHGAIMEMPVVHEVKPLSMSWCLGCHADPAPNLVPKDKITDLNWVRDQIDGRGNQPHAAGADFLDAGSKGGVELLKQLEDRKLHLAPQNCGACHY